MDWHNSELVGFKSSKIKELLNKILNYGDGGFERGLGMLKKSCSYTILKPLKISKLNGYVQRNDGRKLTYL